VAGVAADRRGPDSGPDHVNCIEELAYADRAEVDPANAFPKQSVLTQGG
jgi:hypothetical protein